MKPLGFIILAVILLVVVVGLTLACCYWCPDYYFSGCTPADILGKKKPSTRPLESTPLIVPTPDVTAQPSRRRSMVVRSHATYSTAPITDFIVGLLTSAKFTP